jgi:hypothetical protein
MMPEEARDQNSNEYSARMRTHINDVGQGLCIKEQNWVYLTNSYWKGYYLLGA